MLYGKSMCVRVHVGEYMLVCMALLFFTLTARQGLNELAFPKHARPSRTCTYALKCERANERVLYQITDYAKEAGLNVCVFISNGGTRFGFLREPWKRWSEKQGRSSSST